MRVLFFGSSDYCLPILEAVSASHTLVGIVTREDKPIGRKKELTASAPKRFGMKANIPIFTPKEKNDLLNINSTLRQLRPDVAVVSDYGIIIPPETFILPRLQTVNIHFSKLPEFRGAAPVQYTILRGDRSSWITIQKLDKELDTGDILWQHEEKINDTITTGELYKNLFIIVSKCLPNILNDYAEGRIIPYPQDERRVTYTHRLSREDGFIPWHLISILDRNTSIDPGLISNLLDNWPLYQSILKDLYPNLQLTTCNLQPIIDRVFRAFTPWPGLWTEITVDSKQHAVSSQTKRLKILRAHLELPTANRQPRTHIFVIDVVQLEGKQPAPWKQFRDAYGI